ncbi:hypothetical protein BJ138DRAFT_996415 [Hygrophoropsis aurantiaca]|uniref:Uncharacterized protein n=1 Tax=Hygrophoropsis aurantiaca TaxID=72124 RepID=A0ACB8AS87_9AGAM|nr:hypothetical protein BJ138DRAFT_996415 [Hygrophoropsis aurantiaca]
MAEEREEYLAVLKASYDYEPQADSEDEIAVKENQIVFLLEKTDDDWWKVKIKGDSQDEDSPSGLIPAAYVEQAEHTSLVKAIYDYDSAGPGELTIKEDEVLLVFDHEGDWILVQSQQEGGKAGFVPATYVEETSGEEEPEQPNIPQIIIPPSPEPRARPISTYVDPADRVAQASAKAQADDIKTWAVSEVDKKGKKKKGTLGIGNGAVFFASESDKTPVQKWQTSDIESINVEKNKHVHIELGGANATKLHFNAGSKDTAEAVVAKLESSKGLSLAPTRPSQDISRDQMRTPSPSLVNPETRSPSKKNGASVHFAEESPAIIPPRDSSDDGEEEAEEEPIEAGSAGNGDTEELDGESAIALYDFEGTSADELTVQEGEQLIIIEKEGEEWWKCRNEHGVEGVVPASYLESSALARSTSPSSLSAHRVDDDAAAREEEERLEAERLEEERIARERAEKDRKKKEQEQRAKASAAAAEAERKRREKEEAAAQAEAERRRRQEAAKQAHQTPSPGSTRVWHDRSGQFRVEAALLGYSNGKLRLHKINGVVIEVPSEKMSHEDMTYVKQLMKKSNSSSSRSSPPRRQSNDDDDQPLALKQQREAAKRTVIQQPARKGPQVDWFEFFLGAGCDIDDCTRYASSFERDKIDEAILPDITESTMRSLGLREGDIIRVNKIIQQKYKKNNSPSQEQLLRDEEIARKLQEEENGGKQNTTSPAPNLFAGPGGLLKANTRRGRPQPSKSLPPPAVDLDAISTASDQIKRTGSPRVGSPAIMTPVQAPQRSSSAAPAAGGFDDDAWTNRGGSKPPAAAAAPPAAAATATQRAPSAPPAASAPQITAASTPPPASTQPQTTGSSLAKTDADIFDQLARLSQLRTSNAAPSPGPASAPVGASSPPVTSPPPPTGYNAGLGMGSSPAPLGQHLQNQQTGLLPPPQQIGPRGPFAPVPANQSLLQPLVPTTTGFNNFVPTRPSNSASPFQGQPSFLQTQPTGFSGPSQPLLSQPTGFQPSGPLMSQPTGFQPSGPLMSQPTGFQSSGPFNPQPTGLPPSSFGNFGAQSNFQNPPIHSNPTGFSPFAQSPFNNPASPPPVPPLPSFSPPSNQNQNNTSPANIFAQMKSGTFANGNDVSGPQQPEKYDALRVNPQPTGFGPQATGWDGYQPNGGYQNGYSGY